MDTDLPKSDSGQPLMSHISFAEYAEACLKLKTVYVWGGMGELLSPERLKQKVEMSPEHFTLEKIQSLLKKADGTTRMFDCSGLVKVFLMGGLQQFRYDPAKDLNDLGLLRQATASAPINSLPETAGICLYMDGHVGIYLGNGNVVEATNHPRFGDGVVQTKLSDREWEQWFCCRGIDYSSNRIRDSI